MDANNFIIEFSYFCPKCVHEDKKGFKEPCNTCLEHPVNKNSRKPVKFEEK